jgi:tRNA (guanine-N7-)-methyltransferase
MSSSKAPGVGTEESLIFKPENIVLQLPLAELFPKAQPLHVELGAGDGSFLAAYAKAHPELNFLGVERLLGRLRKIERKSRRNHLENVRLIRIEAAYLTQFLLPAGSVAAVHIYFPDPWPKRRHWKNRLVTPEFTELLRRALQPEGIVYLRTDNEDYFKQMVVSFNENVNFREEQTPAELSAFITDFERNFNLRGIPTLRAAYRKQS